MVTRASRFWGPGRRYARLLTALAMAPLLSCASIRQYPDDPEDTQANLAGYSMYFGSTPIATYSHLSGVERTSQRDAIVLNRMLAFDITYSQFRRRLTTDVNSISTGGDLVGLILTGLAATTGSAATKSALAAAATGVLGAKNAIDSDLYFQRSLPALVAQMDANRSRAQLAILTGLGKPDSDYPLGRALVDLDALRDAGGLTGAIQNLTAAAVRDKERTSEALTLVHGQAFKDSFSDRQKILMQINGLTPPQILALMKEMDKVLAERPSPIRQGVAATDPDTQREKDSRLAKIILGTWANTDQPEELDDSSTAVKFAAEWNAAIAIALSL